MTERERTDIAKHRAQEEWERTFDCVPDLVMILDRDYRIVRTNRAMVERLGLEPGQCVGKRCYECVHGLDAPPSFCPHTRLLADGCEHLQEVYEPRVQGHFLVSVTPLRDETGNVTGSVHVARDITECKRAEQSLRESEERFRFVAESIPHLVWSAQPDGSVDYFNARSVDYLGRTYQEIQGWGWTEAIHPEDRQRSVDAWRQASTSGSEYRIEYRIRSGADGQYRWHVGHAMPYRDREGHTVRWFGTCTDIHARRCAEEELRHLNETLEQRVSEQTTESRRRAAQLQMLVAELSQTEQRERRRLAVALHENLQQLLVAARLKVENLRLPAPNAGSAADEGLRAASEEAVQILDACLAESQALTAQLSPLVLHGGGLVAGLEWLARQMWTDHALHVEVRADRQAEPQSEAIRVILFEAVQQLLMNVVRHARVAGAQVEMTALDDAYLRIVVRDEGVGLSQDQLADYLANVGALGLFSVRERLELLGGRLEITSAPGAGTRTTVIAPRCVKSDPGQSSMAAENSAAGPAVNRESMPRTAAPSQPIRVLLADDHPVMLSGFASALRKEPGIDVVGTARDGQEAVELALETRPDIVLMDVTMPHVDGLAATRRIRAQLPGTRVIGLSMHTEQDMAAAMREAGADAYLFKGEATEKLVATIRRIAAGSPPAPLT